MYTLDGDDQVTELTGVPSASPGTPDPVILADDYSLSLTYVLAPVEVTPEEEAAEGEPFALVQFQLCRAHYFGSPNDEALHGHPLYGRGLRPYGVYEVQNSSWIRLLERRNRVHDRHTPKLFEGLRHLIMTFHDKTFECIAKSWQVTRYAGSAGEWTGLMTRLIRKEGRP